MSEAFVHTLVLRTSPQESVILAKRLEAGRQLYNACLGEGLKRLQLARESKIWQQARGEPKKAERSKLFGEAQKKYKLSDYEAVQRWHIASVPLHAVFLKGSF